jgi:hypothetical protein
MRKLAWTALLLIACGANDKLPDGVLERPKFVQVLAGATLIEARMNQELTVDAAPAIPVRSYYDDLFREQGVDREAFERTVDHYAAHPMEMKAVYEDVLLLLLRQKNEAAQLPLMKADTLSKDSSSVRKR